MKKIVKYLVAAVAMVAAVSCQEELVLNEKPAQDSGKPVFTASLNNLSTKTVLNEETMKSMWYGDEYINVMDFEGINNKYAALGIKEPAAKANFSFAEGADFYGNSVFAVYPYTEENKYWIDGDTYGVVANHWTTQEAVAGTYDPEGTVHVAYNNDFTANNNLVFSNLSALIKFTVTDPGVKNLTIYSLGGEALSGPVTYQYDNGSYVALDKTGGYDYVELYAPKEQYLEVGKSYYIGVIPGTFESGLAVELNKTIEGNKITYKNEGKIVLNPNTINTFGAFETRGDLAWELVGDFNGWTSGEYFTREGDLFVIKNKEFTGDYGKFKIRWYDESKTDNSGWNNEANYGLTFKNVVEAGGVYDLKNAGDSHDAYIHAGTYDIWFDPFGMKLYVMDPGVDPAEAEAIAPTRYVVGTHNGWNIADTTYEMEWDGSWLTSFIEFTEAAEFKTSVGGSWDNANWGVKLDENETTYNYESGSLFDADYSCSNVILPKPGFYMIQQSWDGSSMVVTDVVTPKGQQFCVDGLVFELGTDGMLRIAYLDETDPTVAWMYEDNMMEYPYELIPSGPDTGVISYVQASMGMRPIPMEIAYGINGSEILLYCEDLGFEGTAATLLSGDTYDIKVYEPELPDAQINGQKWRGTFDGKEYLIDLGYTYEGKLAFAELGEDNVWHFIYAGDYYYNGEDASFATVDYADSDFFVFEMPEEVNTGFVYNVYNEALWGEDAVMFANVTEEVFEPFNTPDGKQWGFNWVAMGMGDMAAVLDFGVTMPGACVVAYDPAIMGAPEGTPYQIFNAIQYAFVPVDDESGKLILLSTNMYGEILSQEFEYRDYTGKTCYFAFGEESFVAQDVDATHVDVTVDPNGGIAQ